LTHQVRRNRPKSKGGAWFGAELHPEEEEKKRREEAVRLLADERAAHARSVAKFRAAAKAAARAKMAQQQRKHRRSTVKGSVLALRRSLRGLRDDIERTNSGLFDDAVQSAWKVVRLERDKSPSAPELPKAQRSRLLHISRRGTISIDGSDSGAQRRLLPQPQPQPQPQRRDAEYSAQHAAVLHEQWTLVTCRVLEDTIRSQEQWTLGDRAHVLHAQPSSVTVLGQQLTLAARDRAPVLYEAHRIIPSLDMFLVSSEINALPVVGRSSAVVLCGSRRKGDVLALIRTLAPRCVAVALQLRRQLTLSVIEVVGEHARDLLNLDFVSNRGANEPRAVAMAGGGKQEKSRLEGVTPVWVESLADAECVWQVANGRRDLNLPNSSIILSFGIASDLIGNGSEANTTPLLTIADVAQTNLRGCIALRDAIVASELNLPHTAPSRNSKLTQLLHVCGVGSSAKRSPLLYLASVDAAPRMLAPTAATLLAAAQVCRAASSTTPTTAAVVQSAPPPQLLPVQHSLHVSRLGAVSISTRASGYQ